VNLGKSQGESKGHDLARTKSPLRNAELPACTDAVGDGTKANGYAGFGAESSKTRRKNPDAYRETGERLSIRWKASWVVFGLPFTG
jgi:hypothetical protein